jgi:uncharacterized protein (TIGR02246 family)
MEMTQMTKRIAMAIVALALGGVFGGSEAGGERAQTGDRAEDENAIRRICLERIERFNSRHEPPRAAEFTPDADFVNVYGMWRKGSAEIEARQGERMQTVLKEAKMSLLDLRVRFVRPDVAVVHQTHEMSGMLSPDGQRMPPHRERSIRVVVKERGTWLTTAFHNTIVREAEPLAPTK